MSDYDKGFLFEEDIDIICNNNINVFIDTKKILGDWCKYSTFIKINNIEYSINTNILYLSLVRIYDNLTTIDIFTNTIR